MRERVVVEIDVQVDGGDAKDAERMVRDALSHVRRDLMQIVKVHTARNHGHEIIVREQPTRDQLADWTEPW